MLCSNPACGKEFDRAKKWQRFCSPACRSAGHSKGGADAKSAVRFMLGKLDTIEAFLSMSLSGDGRDIPDPAAAELRKVRSAIKRGRDALK